MGKYDDGTKIVLKVMFKKSFSSTMLSVKKNKIIGWMLTPLLLSTTLYVFCEKLGHLENK